MKPELDNKLCVAFPLLYANRYSSPTNSCMCFGFECDDGWFVLIWELSAKIEQILVANLTNEFEYPLHAAQVKEKFGALRFYMNYSLREINDLINKAEADSYYICEVCGGEGKCYKRGTWLKTCCTICGPEWVNCKK